MVCLILTQISIRDKKLRCHLCESRDPVLNRVSLLDPCFRRDDRPAFCSVERTQLSGALLQ